MGLGSFCNSHIPFILYTLTAINGGLEILDGNCRSKTNFQLCVIPKTVNLPLSRLSRKRKKFHFMYIYRFMIFPKHIFYDLKEILFPLIHSLNGHMAGTGLGQNQQPGTTFQSLTWVTRSQALGRAALPS